MKIFFNSEVDAYGIQDLLRLFFGTCTRLVEPTNNVLLGFAVDLADNLAEGSAKEFAEDLTWAILAEDDDCRIFELSGMHGWTSDCLNTTDACLNLNLAENRAAVLASARLLACRDDSLNLLIQIGLIGKLTEFCRPKRDNKRLLYFALCKLTGKTFPWGSLTGIRPTLIAAEAMKITPNHAAAENLLVRYYGVSLFKAQLALTTAREEQHILRQLPPDTCGVYIAIPFCPTRCLYCSFSTNEGIDPPNDLINRYIDALSEEIELTFAQLPFKISTLYVGGGTPGILTAEQIARLGQIIHRNIEFIPGAELTFEAGRPDRVDQPALSAVYEAGFQKICLNPQTFHDRTLALVNRQHTVEQLISTYEMARRMPFTNINMDLILGLPGETEADMRYTLKKLESLSPDSFTLHSLAIKRASNLKLQAEDWLDVGAVHRRNKVLESLQEEGRALANRLGLVPYYMYRQKDGVGGLENLGYARPGCGNRYNLAMMGDGLSILSFGAGAMSKAVSGDKVERSPNVRSIQAYIERHREMSERKIIMLRQMNDNVIKSVHF